MKALLLTIAVCVGLFGAGCGGDEDSETTTSGETTAAEATGGEASGEGAGAKTKPTVTVPSGEPPAQLQVKDLEEGTGAEAKAGDEVTVQYVLVAYKGGEEIEASWDRNEPFSFTLGAGEVIPGWDRGIEGMKVGGRRELVIPPDLAYGPAGSPPAIAPEETLIFVVDLLEVG